MKKITFIAIALLALCMMPVSAQEDFDFDNASNFHLIMLDESSEDYWDITSRIAKDFRLNGDYGEGGVNTGERIFDIWDNTFVVNPVTDKGALGQIGNYMSMTSLAANWGGGGFVLIPQPGSTSKVDFTAITDEYRFHMAIKKSTASPCIINVAGGGDPDGKVDLGQTAHFTVGANENVWPDNSPPNLTPDFVVNQWQIIDIPITELKDLGWSNRGTFSGGGQYYLSWDLGPVNGNNLDMDATFFYKVGASSDRQVAVDNKLKVLVTNKIVEVLNATAPIEVYDLTGVKVLTTEASVFGVDELNKGVYIIKSGSAVAKVLIK